MQVLSYETWFGCTWPSTALRDEVLLYVTWYCSTIRGSAVRDPVLPYETRFCCSWPGSAVRGEAARLATVHRSKVCKQASNLKYSSQNNQHCLMLCWRLNCSKENSFGCSTCFHIMLVHTSTNRRQMHQFIESLCFIALFRNLQFHLQVSSVQWRRFSLRRKGQKGKKLWIYWFFSEGGGGGVGVLWPPKSHLNIYFVKCSMDFINL